MTCIIPPGTAELQGGQARVEVVAADQLVMAAGIQQARGPPFFTFSAQFDSEIIKSRYQARSITESKPIFINLTIVLPKNELFNFFFF